MELLGCFGIPGSVDLIANADFMFYERNIELYIFFLGSVDLSANADFMFYHRKVG